MQFPSDETKTLVEVSFGIQDLEPMITGWHGRMNPGIFEEISEAVLDPEFYHFTKGAGEYLFEVSWEPEQTGEFDRVELTGYWDFLPMAFREFKTRDGEFQK